MLTRIWTSLLLSLACVTTIAWFVALMHEKDIRPVRDFIGFLKERSKAGRIVICVFFIAMWTYASTKPGDGGNGGGDGGNGGTNNVPQLVVRPGLGELDPMTLPGGVVSELSERGNFNPGIVSPLSIGETLNLSGFNTITSTNTTRTLSAEDFARGFVQTRTETGETHDFTPPANVVICPDWRAFGAATDWVYAAFTNWAFRVGTNDVSRLRVYSFGKIVPLIREVDGTIATNYWFAPFMASLGIVPQANWSWLDEADRPSQMWHSITPENSLLVTWQNALLDRDTDTPLSFQIEFMPDGQFIYRYDLSRLNADAVTNILAGASFSESVHYYGKLRLCYCVSLHLHSCAAI